MKAITAAGSIVALWLYTSFLSEASAVDVEDGASVENSAACDVDEIQLASDGTIAQWGLALGTRVAPNMTVNGTVLPDDYNFYHVCVARHEHEHLIKVELVCDRDDLADGGDANLYLSSDVKYPRMGRSTWIAQRPGNELVNLHTYLDGFPRKDEGGGTGWIAVHIGVFGGGDVSTNYNLTVSVTDLPTTTDVKSRQQYYTEQRQLARKQRLRRG